MFKEMYTKLDPSAPGKNNSAVNLCKKNILNILLSIT